MPSVSQKQHNLMEMVAHGGKPDSVKAPPMKVAKEFAEADKGKKVKKLPFQKGKEVAKAKALRKPRALDPDHDGDAHDAGGLSGTGVGGM